MFCSTSAHTLQFESYNMEPRGRVSWWPWQGSSFRIPLALTVTEFWGDTQQAVGQEGMVACSLGYCVCVSLALHVMSCSKKSNFGLRNAALLWLMVWTSTQRVCFLWIQESRADVCRARGLELRPRERQTGDLWRCFVQPCQEREGETLVKLIFFEKWLFQSGNLLDLVNTSQN